MMMKSDFVSYRKTRRSDALSDMRMPFDLVDAFVPTVSLRLRVQQGRRPAHDRTHETTSTSERNYQ